MGLRCCAQAFSSCSKRGATLHCGARASHCGGFSCCGARALGTQTSVAVAGGLSSCGTRALGRRLNSCGARAKLLCSMWESSWTRARTCVPCVGSQILNHCATREVPLLPHFFSHFLLSVWTHVHLFYTLGHNPVLCHLFTYLLKSLQLWPAASPSGPPSPPCPCDTPPSFCFPSNFQTFWHHKVLQACTKSCHTHSPAD